MRQFVDKCLATVSLRLSARELLNDPFLQINDAQSELRPLDYRELDGMGPLIRQPHLELHNCSNSSSNGYANGHGYEAQNDWSYHSVEVEPSGIELFEHHVEDHSTNVDISIKGKRRDDGGIFLRLRIADKEGLGTFSFSFPFILHFHGLLTFHFCWKIQNQLFIDVSFQVVSETYISHLTLKLIQHSAWPLKWLRSWILLTKT